MDGQLRYVLFFMPEEESLKFPGERLNLGYGYALLEALLLLFSNSFNLAGLAAGWKAEGAWKLTPQFSLWMESLFRLLLLFSRGLKLCIIFFAEAEELFCFLSCPNDSSVKSLSKDALVSLMNFSWIFFNTSCLRYYRVLTYLLGTILMIFSIQSTNWLKLTKCTQLLIQLVFLQCSASTILLNFLSYPQLLYSISSTKLPFSKYPLTQFFFSQLRRIPCPSKTLSLNSPTQTLPFLNIFSPIPLSCVFMQYPLQSSLSSNQSSFRWVSGLYPPCAPRQRKLNPSPLMKPFFQKPTIMRLPCFCAQIRGILGKSYFIVLAWVVPMRKSVYPRSKTRLNTLKSFYSDLSIMLPFLNSAYIMLFVIWFSSTALPSSSPSGLQLRKTRKPSVRYAHSTNLFLLYIADSSPQLSKKMLWPWRRSLQQDVIAEAPSSWSRMPRPFFLKDFMPPMQIAFLQWQQQIEEVVCAAPWDCLEGVPVAESLDLEGLRLLSDCFFIGDFFIYYFISVLSAEEQPCIGGQLLGNKSFYLDNFMNRQTKKSKNTFSNNLYILHEGSDTMGVYVCCRSFRSS